MEGLEADTDYIYQVHHAGADPLAGRFRTAPVGRSKKFRFTSFGDQSVPMPNRRGPGRVPSARRGRAPFREGGCV
jgi:hypothetical protein